MRNGINERSERLNSLGHLLLFGSPVLTLTLFFVLDFFYDAALIPLSVAFIKYRMIFNLLNWVAGSVFAGLGSAVGGALVAHVPESRWGWSRNVSVFAAFVAGAISYALLSVSAYVLLVTYVMLFRWV